MQAVKKHNRKIALQKRAGCFDIGSMEKG